LLARHRAHAAGLEEHPYTDGVITGWGTIDGRKVFIFSQDFTVFGGALGEVTVAPHFGQGPVTPAM
jgi:acetyl-CoA carboxylase carboxyltransferase component